MEIDIKQQIKEILLKENLTMTDLVNKLNENKPDNEKTTLSSLNNKLTRGTIKYSEILEVFDILGYNIILQKRNMAEAQPSKSYKPILAGAVAGLSTGGILGGIVGGTLGATWGKSGTTTGGKINNTYSNNIIDDELLQLELEQDRLDLEHDVEVNINAILDEIILNCEDSVKDKYNDLIESYLSIKDFPITFKLTSMYRVVFKFLSAQSDSGLREFLTKLRNIYVHGGLMDFNDDELMHLFETSRYYRELLREKKND